MAGQASLNTDGAGAVQIYSKSGERKRGAGAGNQARVLLIQP